MAHSEGNYEWMEIDPPVPSVPYPSLAECKRFEFMRMSQMCEITEQHGLGRHHACKAFGGDCGRGEVSPERMVRAVKHGTEPRKFVLTSAVIDYMIEVGILKW